MHDGFASIDCRLRRFQGVLVAWTLPDRQPQPSTSKRCIGQPLVHCLPQQFPNRQFTIQAHGVLPMLIFRHIAETMTFAPPVMRADAGPLAQGPEGLNSLCAPVPVSMSTAPGHTVSC